MSAAKPNPSSPQRPAYFCVRGENIREVRPLSLLLLGALALLYGLALANRPALRAWPLLVPCTLLLLAHMALHWVGPYLTTRRRWLAPYLLVQGALALALGLLARQPSFTLALGVALASEAVGIVEDLRRSLLAVAGYLALSALSVALVWGWAALPSWFAVAAPLTFFVVTYVAAFVRQAQARERTAAVLRQLETAHGQLADYATQVEELTLVAERRRMARELHDTLAQDLAGLILLLEAADAQLGRGRLEQAQAIIGQAMARARTALAEGRRAIADLRDAERQTDARPEAWPAEPQPLGAALHAEAARFTEATGLPCHLSLDLPAALPAPVQEPALRAVAEGLANVARHARAAQAWVDVAASDGRLRVSVRDDGVGFDAAAPLPPAGHYGLIGLRERARLAGGSLFVASTPGRGTALAVDLPLDATEGAHA